MQSKIIQGVEVPEIGLGTFKLIGKECESAVKTALSVGYRHIDTAQFYNNEREVGNAIRSSHIDREKIFVTTKVWRDNLSYDRVLSSTEESLRSLDLEYVDLLLVHWPNNEVDLWSTLEALLVLRDQGKALHFGVSNFPIALLNEIKQEISAPIFCNQVEYHPYLAQYDLLDEAAEHDFMLTAYCPLAHGKVLNDPLLQQLGEKYGKTSAQVALRWLIEQEQVVAIPKSGNEERIKQNIDIYDFELEDDDFDAIDALERGMRLINPDFAPKWD